MKMNETVAELVYDELLTSPITKGIIGVAELDESAKEAKRGTLLGFAEPGDKLKIVGAEDGLTPCAILAKDADGETVAQIYKTGTFNIEAVLTEEEYEITDEDLDTLRKYDIYFDKAVY